MRRAAVSIMANIAEGFSRQSNKEICAVSIYCQIIKIILRKGQKKGIYYEFA